MKGFKEFVNEEGEGGVPANAVGTGQGVAGLTGDPPVSKKKQREYQKQNNMFKPKALQK